MRRRQALSTIALASLAFTAETKRAQSAERVQVAGPMAEDATNLFYGVKSGAFERAGLSVEIVTMATGAAATTAMITGTYDIAKTSLLAVFSAHLAGIPIVIVEPALINQPQHPSSLLQVAPDSTIKTGADLNGKVCGCSALNDIAVLGIRAWSDKNGGDWKSLKFVELPNSAMEAALQAHRVDAGILQNPQLDASLTAGTTKTLGDAFSAIAPTYMAAVYIARRDWAAQHADTLRRFNEAYLQATRYVNTHAPETVPYAAELTKIEPAVMAKMRRSQNGTVLDAALLQPIIDAAVKYQTLPRAFSAREILLNG